MNLPLIMSASLEKDPRDLARHARQLMQSLQDLLRENVAATADPKAQALFETSAEVLGGLATAFDHFDRRAENAWQ